MADKYSFIVVKYPKAETAAAALAVVKGLASEKIVKLRDAVAITKTEKGKIKLQQTKDDSAGKGFLKGGAIGVLLALLFGPPGWIVAGAALGTAFSMFDRGIKNKLLKELGENMTAEQSALAVLVEEADWEKVLSRMASNNFQGEIIVRELIAEHLEAVEKLLDAPTTIEPVPDELAIAESESPDVPPIGSSASAGPGETF